MSTKRDSRPTDVLNQKSGAILLVQAVDYDTRTLAGFQPLCAPLSIATIAALTPSCFEVDLWDENLSGLIGETTQLPRARYDIVGISTLFEHVGRRVPALAKLFQARDSHVCCGGPGIANQLSLIRTAVDTVFVNEAEYTWPAFLRDWLSGAPKSEYVQITKPDLADSPPPAWDSLASEITRYRSGGVQTTRGCPFDCEFCDVIYLYGRSQRHKPIDRVLKEVINLQRLGVSRVFFTDDEFIGDPRYASNLLSELVPLNNSFPFPLAYHTQLTMNLSRNESLLELVADANFWHVLIGIESFDEESLRETNKIQNTRRDIVADCKKILSYGIGINGSLIIGFDHDGPDVFERILNGVQAACIPFATVSILRATYGTKLWTRMRENRRLWQLPNASSVPEALRMDILPAGELSRTDLIEGRVYVNKELSKVENLSERLCSWVTLVQRLPQVENPAELQLDEATRRLRQHAALQFTPKELRLLEGTLEHTRDRAPILMGRVFDSIVAQLYWYRIRTFHTDEELKEILAAERAGYLVQDMRPIVLPSAFAAAFRKRLFPLVYARLEGHIDQRDIIPELASDIFVDFLIRENQDPRTANSDSSVFAGPRQIEFLRALCDRAVVQVTGRPDRIRSHEETLDSGVLRELKRSGMYDAVLKNVGDRLAQMSS